MNVNTATVNGHLSSTGVLSGVRILGVTIAPFDLDRAVKFVLDSVQDQKSCYVCIANAHTTAMAAQRQHFRAALNGAAAVVADGMPVVWRARFAGYSQVGRVYGADLVKAVCRVGVQSGVRHGFFGGLQDTAELMAAELLRQFPDVKIAGLWNPGLIREGEPTPATLVNAINKSECDVLWVGLGAPKQELWMAQHRSILNASVLVGVGQAFDIVARRTKEPPYWVGTHGLEWLYRLLKEPGRLWKRYSYYNTLFLWYSFLETFGHRDRY